MLIIFHIYYRYYTYDTIHIIIHLKKEFIIVNYAGFIFFSLHSFSFLLILVLNLLNQLLAAESLAQVCSFQLFYLLSFSSDSATQVSYDLAHLRFLFLLIYFFAFLYYFFEIQNFDIIMVLYLHLPTQVTHSNLKNLIPTQEHLLLLE